MTNDILLYVILGSIGFLTAYQALRAFWPERQKSEVAEQ